MIRTLQTFPDFEKTVARFEAWWHGQIVDRPPVTLWVRPRQPQPGPPTTHRTLRERWLDAEWVVESFMAGLEGREFAGDGFPVFYPNLGPEITATLYGCDLEFSESTSWSQPVVHSPQDWERVCRTKPDFTNPYWRAIEKMTDLAIERCQGRYIVGMTDLHGNYDILAALRDPQDLCTDLLDAPELVEAAARHVVRGFVEAFCRNHEKVSAAGFGSTTWLPMYHEGPAYVPSCDFWCMLSPRMARERVLPTILEEMKPLERSIFHLDGPQALPHLDLLLELPQLNAVQWVYGDGAGPARRWTGVYRRIREAGKSLQLLAEDPADALAVLEVIGTEGVWIRVGRPFESVAEAKAFLQRVA